MFGRRTASAQETPAPAQRAAKAPAAPGATQKAVKPAAKAPAAPPRVAKPAKEASQQAVEIGGRSDAYFQTKTTIFNALIDTIDLSQLAQLDTESAAGSSFIRTQGVPRDCQTPGWLRSDPDKSLE